MKRMRRLSFAFLLLVLPIALCAQQKINGRILLVRSTADAARFDSLVRLSYKGLVVTDTSVPTMLDTYDAIMIENSLNGSAHYDLGYRLDLIAYARQGGRLYLGNFRMDQVYKRPFWDSLGLTSFVGTALTVSLDSLRGASGEFTEGLNYSLDFGSEMGYYSVEGAIKKVLFAGDRSMQSPIAWIPADATLRVVSHNEIANPQYLGEFYNRVLCTYFNLCAADVQEPAKDGVRIQYSDQGVIVSVNDAREALLKVYDIAGRERTHFELKPGDNLIPLNTLPSGPSLLVVQHGGAISVLKYIR